MSGLIPFRHPFWRGGDWWDWPTASRIFDQNFAVEPFDDSLLKEVWQDPFGSLPYWARPRPVLNEEQQAKTGMSEVKNDSTKFAVNMDVKHFMPEEIKVKTVDNMIVIEGKHDEKMDEHGFISRSFTRKYVLPKGANPEKVVSRLSPNGVLTIEAPKEAVEQGPHERAIPIQMSQCPAVASTQ